ncbi:hypothetical protein [Aestuariirhabdus litorea]|uniref:Uncharacterized protein n=1 Tax=Aestuariirhabdus litorea TaxID=2528527 RepID=A0A3P3VMF9_9GAMM|nr:hypothetical protein [Aestuariirhabdus litorea]RRJ83614.1 hypothetical protein D0544_00365 [Aestuariirhabdus litorea]RWW96835.1 hypothetical protein DZC74_00365 [Endozoicomonadaceae bacterium GTF-13]
MKEHGSFEITRRGRIIECDCSGTWNRETADRYCRQHRALVRQIGSQPWAKILDLRGWELGTPDVVVPLRELYVWCVLHGQVRQVNIRHQSLFKQFHLENIVPTDSSIEFLDEDDWEAARARLAAEGFLS